MNLENLGYFVSFWLSKNSQKTGKRPVKNRLKTTQKPEINPVSLVLTKINWIIYRDICSTGDPILSSLAPSACCHA